MRSDMIVIASVGSQDVALMSLTQDDKMIHTLAPDRPDQPFGKPILPRRGRCGRLVSDSHGAHSTCDNAAVIPMPIADELDNWQSAQFTQLANNPNSPLCAHEQMCASEI
jgi:hypothetical protein